MIDALYIVAYQEYQQWRSCIRHPRQLEKVVSNAKAFMEHQVVIWNGFLQAFYSSELAVRLMKIHTLYLGKMIWTSSSKSGKHLPLLRARMDIGSIPQSWWSLHIDPLRQTDFFGAKQPHMYRAH